MLWSRSCTIAPHQVPRVSLRILFLGKKQFNKVARSPCEGAAMRLVKALALLLSTLGLAVSLWGQTGTSTIRGTVTDPQGRVVAGATVTLTNVATNAVRTTKSTDSGSFVFDLITPADYRLQVEAKGFRKQIVDNVKALIGKPTETNVQLGVGAQTEVVEVQASAQD